MFLYYLFVRCLAREESCLLFVSFNINNFCHDSVLFANECDAVGFVIFLVGNRDILYYVEVYLHIPL